MSPDLTCIIHKYAKLVMEKRRNHKLKHKADKARNLISLYYEMISIGSGQNQAFIRNGSD